MARICKVAYRITGIQQFGTECVKLYELMKSLLEFSVH